MAEIDWVLQRNLRFLEDYLALDPWSIGQKSANLILELVKEQPGVHPKRSNRSASTSARTDDSMLTLMDGSSAPVEPS